MSGTPSASTGGFPHSVISFSKGPCQFGSFSHAANDTPATGSPLDMPMKIRMVLKMKGVRCMLVALNFFSWVKNLDRTIYVMKDSLVWGVFRQVNL